jgi:signal peptidase I
MSDIKSFRQFLEAITKEITVTFGRFNPPTIGHEKLLNAVSSEAAGGIYRIYASHSVDPKKNPLEYTEKVKLMRTLFPKHARNIINDDSIKTILDIATKAYEDGFTRFVLVVGQDRVAEFSKLLQKYEGTKLNNGGFYEFPNGIEVVSAGDRDPDADDVEGMSASKMRQAVRDGNFKEFSQGLPKSYDKGLDLFNLLRKRMDLNEMANFREHIQLSPLSQIREAYVRGEVFNVGDVVRLKGGEVVQIVKRGPNFLVTEDNRKHWLKDVEPIMEETKIKAWVANPLNIKEGWAHDEHKRVKGKYVLYIDSYNQQDELTKRSHIQSGLDAISQQPQDAFKVFRNMNGDTVFQEIKYLPHFYLI